ncbi:hypothetical protein J0H58_18645 [bacterium]|nr:hypothetical protein [bacterium]
MDLAKYAAKFDPTEAFRQLADPDPAVRLVGAKWVEKQSRGAVNNFTEPWLKDVATMSRLLPLLADPDELVVEELTGAVNMIVSRYRKDARAMPPAVKLVSSTRKNTRLRAALILTNFPDPALADVLLPLFTDPDKQVRAIVMKETANEVLSWPADLQERTRQAALARLADRAAEVRAAAATLLITVGTAADVPTLKAALKTMEGHNYRQDFRESIGLLEAALKRKR